MDAKETELYFDEKFPENDTNKTQNDPWTVLPDKINIPNIIGIQTDPLRDQINSEKYLESLGNLGLFFD